MKKSILSTLFVFFLIIGNITAQVTGETKGWPSDERYAFINECINTAKEHLSEDSARFYCYCMQFKVEKKYPTIELAATITEADMNSPEWQKDIKGCLNGGTWTAADRSTFLNECITSAKGSVGDEKAKIYCECMLYKVEVKFPNPEDAGTLTAEKLATPEWKKIIQSCLDF